MYEARDRDTLTVVQGQLDLESWMSDIRQKVDIILSRFFELKQEESVALSPRAIDLVTEVRDLTMRGGKRLRPIVTAAAYRAASGDPDPSPTLEVGASLELLQSYLLIHDDWMDEDDERRGGPAVHFAFAKKHGDAHLGASLGVLAGDLASTFSWELFLESSLPKGRRDEALDLFVDIQKEVFAGQQLDLMADQDVERMHRLKTGSYTTRGPAELGGLLADASKNAMESLRSWAVPVGIAFQLRDDLLSTFSTTRETGKPGDDLRHGKHNAVVAAFHELSPSELDRAALARVWGHPDASNAEVEEAARALSGARVRVEERLICLGDEARSALAASPFDDEGKQVLANVTTLLTERGS
ncbi:MAG: polyprenyl synthetase family protein [Myxococcales bacterium]|nr:polyprenyl synthetase family protein [Myxococcales bacterium]